MIRLMLVAAALWAGCQSRVVAAELPAQIVVSDLGFPEGTIFVGDTLYFVDYARSQVLRVVGGKAEVIWHQAGCGANGLVAVPSGLLVACFESGTIVGISMTGAPRSLLQRDDRGHPFTAPNDLVADSKGGVYFTASGNADVPGKVFYLHGGAAREVASGVAFANGIGLSPDGATLYVAETPTGRVLAYAVKPDGSLEPSRELIRLRDAVPATGEPVTPDSLRVDKQGRVFVALYKGGGVAIVSPAGALIAVASARAAHHTNLAISPDGASLYVAAVDDDPRSTYRGQIVRIRNPVAP